jgi:hypothetical protein
MQSGESEKIVERFFEALYILKRKRVIRGKQTFTRKYGINNWNLWLLEQDKSRDILHSVAVLPDYGLRHIRRMANDRKR